MIGTGADTGLKYTRNQNGIWEDRRKKLSQIAQTLLHINPGSFPPLRHHPQSIEESSITGPECFEICVYLWIKIETYHCV